MSVRRDSSDEKWQELKARVRKRDQGHDRILRVLSMKEALLLQRLAPRTQLQKLDCAHIHAVGVHPRLCYVDANVVLLNRYSHENLDNMRHPIDGSPITMEENLLWWQRILGDVQWKTLERVKHKQEDVLDEYSCKLES